MKNKFQTAIILSTILAFFASHFISSEILNISDNTNKKTVIVKVNKTISKTNTPAAKKRSKNSDDILNTAAAVVFPQHFYIGYNLIQNSDLIPERTRYLVQSRATFS